tara:strand:+ start:596 stop:1102 length:507 start_codon:yes stop_codon:yes gene_type:complete
MGLGDRIRAFISDSIDGELSDLKGNVRKITSAMRQGGGDTKEMDDVIKKLDQLEKTKETLSNLGTQVEGFLDRAKTAKASAEKLREANVIASALNPAAAAITLVQEKLIGKSDEEITDLGSAVGGVGPTVDKVDNEVTVMKKDLDDAKKDQEDKKARKADRDRMLGRG